MLRLLAMVRVYWLICISIVGCQCFQLSNIAIVRLQSTTSPYIQDLSLNRHKFDPRQAHKHSRDSGGSDFPGQRNTTEIQRAATMPQIKMDFVLYTPQVLATDILALLISCELLGLLDILRDPAFLDSGGWWQPVTTPSTLSTLLQRFSVNAAVYVTSAVVVQDSTRRQGKIGKHQDQEDVVISALWTAAVFSLLRVLLDVAILITATTAVQWTTFSVSTSLLQVVRDCYVVSLSTVAGRYIYHQLYR
jgi:hypothetical protein